ncbi:MAG: CcmD family protein [Calditrichaeota bacterium]|nr:CcmD family protein [Calditrichota bacterium]
MGKMFYLVSAYIVLWAVLFGYILNLLKKQKVLSRELENLKKQFSQKDS